MEELLENRGVKLTDIAEIVYDAQIKYSPDITIEGIVEILKSIINKREVKHAILTGLELDRLAEQNLLSEELQEILMIDKPLYGIDEILALSITNIYGSIALTNFGYFDKMKPKIIGRLNEIHKGKCYTFLDDIICALAAAACAKLAHNK